MRKIFKYTFFSVAFLIVVFLMKFNTYAASDEKNIEITEVKNTKGGVGIKWKTKYPAEGYIIYRRENGKDYKKYDKTTSKKYVDGGADTGNQYQYKVKGYLYKKGVKKYSNKSEGSDVVIAKPRKIVKINAVQFEDYNLLWWDFNPCVSGYNIYRKKEGDSWKLLETMDISELSLGQYEDYTISEGKQYKYKISSYEIVNGIKYESKESDTAKPKTAKGIDVSKYNGKIDWEKVRESGISFAMIRVGYGLGSGGVMDSRFAYNYEKAKKYGVRVGAYFYGNATSKKQAKAEAKFALKILDKYETKYGDLDFPISYDYENSYRNKRSLRSANTKIVQTFCDYLEDNGYDTSVYSFIKFFKDALDYKKISEYGLWIARWTYDSKKYSDYGFKNVEMWQYSDRGRLPGITEYTDLDLNIINN